MTCDFGCLEAAAHRTQLRVETGGREFGGTIEVMLLRESARNIIVSLSGVIVIVIIGHVMFEWNAHHFDARNPAFGLLASLLK